MRRDSGLGMKWRRVRAGHSKLKRVTSCSLQWLLDFPPRLLLLMIPISWLWVLVTVILILLRPSLIDFGYVFFLFLLLFLNSFPFLLGEYLFFFVCWVCLVAEKMRKFRLDWTQELNLLSRICSKFVLFLSCVGVQDVYDASSVHWCWHMETKYLHNFEVLRQLSFERTVFFSCSRYKGTVESCIWYTGWLKFRLAKHSCFGFQKLPGWSSSKWFVLSMILKYLHLDSNLTEQTEAFSFCKSHLLAIWSEERYTILKHNCYWVECYIHPFMV